MPCNNVERAVVSDSVHIPSMMYCVSYFHVLFITCILEISVFLYCVIIVIIIIIIIVIIIKHFHQTKTVIVTIRNLE